MARPLERHGFRGVPRSKPRRDLYSHDLVRSPRNACSIHSRRPPPAAGGALLTADLLATNLVHVAPDLALGGVEHAGADHEADQHIEAGVIARLPLRLSRPPQAVGELVRDRKSVVAGQSDSVRVAAGGHRPLKRKKI